MLSKVLLFLNSIVIKNDQVIALGKYYSEANPFTYLLIERII